ncbi:hypothetical protein NCAS_0E00850 [Naumovozyma castellii]|uniref:Uncharacterized protein n=1 Tax=Naumovozyma castellii TaxID=27288 RepID=G0VF90_NAUCA|nr:hypothetical protein NCAS_0E00850 [Naumovozyma castellii CBS 4309]CCC70155.1 hypothetical protein NCAS_0E00850 [Naumovozyma castellii CBS 4309]
MEHRLSTTSTEHDFEDVSSFSSIDSYQPEPFTGVKEPTAYKGTDRKDTLSGDETELKQEHTNATATSSHTKDGITSRTSMSTLRRPDSNAIERVITSNAKEGNTETLGSLAAKGLDLNKKATLDINAPLTSNPADVAFPEEYNLETETGLVKAKTIETLRRETSRVSSTRRGDDVVSHKSQATGKSQRSAQSLQAEKLNLAVEKNKKELEKIEKHKHQKGLKGFMNRLFD